jgi:integrase
VAVLRSFHAARVAEHLALGLPWDENGYVAAHPDGSPINPKTLTRWHREHCAAAGPRRIRLHDMRHSYATASLRAGVRREVLAKRLGHSEAVLTKIYAHIMPSDDHEAAATAAAAIWNA